MARITTVGYRGRAMDLERILARLFPEATELGAAAIGNGDHTYLNVTVMLPSKALDECPPEKLEALVRGAFGR